MEFPADCYITYNGRILQQKNTENLDVSKIRLHPRLVGGKGGFGSMLRAIGARIEKTTNHEACRDLNGRRMRDVNNEKKITEWVQDQDTKEKERVQRRNEKLERTLNPKMKYEDKDYTKSLQGNVDKVNEAVKIATQRKTVNTGEKRKNIEKATTSKKKKMWLGVDDLSEEDSENDEETVHIKKEIQDESNDAATIHSDKVESTENQTSSNHKVEMPPIENIISDKTVEKDMTPNSATKEPPKKEHQEPTFLCLDEYKNADELEAVGLERLKSALMYHNMKCGGTLQERAKRLFLTKDKALSELDSSLFVKKKGKK